MTLEKTIKNAQGEVFRSLCNEIRQFNEHRDFNKIVEWTNIQSYLSSKYAYYFLTGKISPVKAEVFREAYDHNYLDPDPKAGGW